MDFSTYTNEQLLDLNKAICAELSARRTEANAGAVRKFAQGDEVYYIAKNGAKVMCVVDKPLRTNVDVTTAGGRLMRIPASLLKFKGQ